MKIHFESLTNLNKHTTYLQKIFGDNAIFIVWWTVRDLLLWRIQSPLDIDITGVGHPDTIRKTMHFNESSMSRFRTEKYWTITVIPKNSDGSSSQINYEYTPFRAESEYTDNRHPDTIQWSESLIADSARRDFTINALYRTPLSSRTIQSTSTSSLPKKNLLTHCLLKQLPVVIIEHACIVLTNHIHIQNYTSFDVLPKHAVFLTQIWNHYVLSNESSCILHHCINDPQWGVLDLLVRKIKTVWDPNTRYQEDALRLMRWLRFANTLNQWLQESTKQNSWFDFEKKTWEQLVENSSRIQHVASERHYQELMKVFKKNNPFGYISTLKTAWLLTHIFPALADTINNHQPTRHHALDTFSHTLMVLYHIQQRCMDPLVKFAVLYHDVWKPEQYEFMEHAKSLNPDKPDREWFRHHAEISVELAQRDFRKLSFPKSYLEKICRYIKRHHRPWEILDSKPIKREQKIRKLMSDWGYTETLKLIDIAIADRLGQYNPLQPPAIHELLDMQETVHSLFKNEWRFTMKNLVINGSWLMTTFDLTPWPELGDLLKRIFEWVLGDVSWRNNEKQIMKLVEWLLKQY